MPPSDDTNGESFRGLVLLLRGRTGLTQRELAMRVGVNVSSVQGWEAGANYPGVASLKALIAAGLQAGGFTAGREAEEAAALWATALRDAPRFRTPFDGAWFEQIAAGRREPVRGDVPSDDIATAPRTSAGGRGRSSWGEAPDVVDFVGRAGEREVLGQWASDERCRLVAVLGLGGIGKSLLATRVARDLAPAFDYVFWRSLRDAPAPGEWLAEAIGFLAPNAPDPPQAGPAQARQLLELLGDARCLLVLDNFETVLQPGGAAGDYRPGYERYGVLLRQVAEAPHRSCLVVTSREEPPELGPLRGEHGPIRALDLGGLGVDDGQALLRDGDGRLVASGSFDGMVRLWEAEGGRPRATLDGHVGGVWGVALSGDGRLVASGGYDGMVRLWEADGGRPLATLHGHTGLVLGVTLSDDGRLVSSGGVDGTVRLWDASSGALRRTLRAERRYQDLDITSLTGITDAQRRTLLTLGAVERRGNTTPSA